MKQANTRKLSKSLGLMAATISGIGVIIGAGIYVIVGAAAGRAGNAVWLSFVFAAIGATFTGISYARLGRLQPKNAPEFQFMKMAFGVFPGFLTGWLIIWAVIISGATVALGFGSYLEHLLGVPAIYGAAGLIAFMTLVAIIGIGESILIAGILTAIGVAGLLLVIGVGIPYLGDVNLLEMPTGIFGVIGAASLVFFAYLGFEGMANFAEEMRNPKRDLPRAIILSLVISTFLYILVAIAAVSVMGWENLSRTDAPLAQVAALAIGSNANLFIAVVALASTANTVLLLVIAASRAVWAMSLSKVFPYIFSIVGRRRRTPWLAILIICFFTLVFTSFRNIEQVAELTNFAILICFAAINVSAIKLLGYKRAEGAAGSWVRHIFLNIIPPVIGGAVCLWLAANLGWQAALFGLGLLVLGAIIYRVQMYFFRRAK